MATRRSASPSPPPWLQSPPPWLQSPPVGGNPPHPPAQWTRSASPTIGRPEGATSVNLHVRLAAPKNAASPSYHRSTSQPADNYYYHPFDDYHDHITMQSPEATLHSTAAQVPQRPANMQQERTSPLSMRLSMPFRSVFSRGFRSDLLDFNHFDNVFRGFDQDLPGRGRFEDYDRDPFAIESHFDNDPFFNPHLNQDPAMLQHSAGPFRRDSGSGGSSRMSYARSSSSGSTGSSGNLHQPAGELEDTVQHLIHSEPPDQLQQRVKIFIAQDRARSLDLQQPGSPGGRQHFPRISARLPHGGSLSFSFSTTSTTMQINGPGSAGAMDPSQVPPHPLLTIEQKRQLKERLLAQKHDLIQGPNTSATILSSEYPLDAHTRPGTPVPAGSGANSVAERVMWFEGVPQLHISHQPNTRTHRSAAHIALQNWKMANQAAMGEGLGMGFGTGFARPPSVEREIPIIRESDTIKPTSSAISITLETPTKQSARVSPSSADILTPSKPGNHTALSTAVITPQMPVITELPRVPPASSVVRKDLDPERIIPTILPAPEPKPVDRKWLREKEPVTFEAPVKEMAVKTPTRIDVQKASENIMRALQNGMRKEERQLVKEKVVLPEPVAVPVPAVKKAPSPPKTVASPPPVRADIPPFHYPRGKPTPRAESEYVLMEKLKKACSVKPDLQLEDMKEPIKVLGLPFYWRRLVFLAALGPDAKETATVTFDMIWNTWKRITANCYDDASRFVSLLAKPGCDYLLPNDFLPLVQDVVDTHPGLNILKEAPEFHARYINTVIARIFFCVNRSWSGSITIEELRRSNFLQVLATLELEDDINVITEYFSYEHFYVIYCKFWELDRDHDLLIDKADLARHNDHAISSKMIDRIFSGAVTRGPSQKEGKMSYSEFVWFLISEEDKRHPRSIEYWFRCMDIDGDGVLSLYELEYFYVEQLQRMKALGIEALPFEDIACQMLDMVHPKHTGKILLTDLKRCRMTPLFFDTFFNIEKYLLHEHRDPFASAKVDSEDNEPISDWDRYAAEEYELLVSEDAATEDL